MKAQWESMIGNGQALAWTIIELIITTRVSEFTTNSRQVLQSPKELLHNITDSHPDAATLRLHGSSSRP